MVQSLDAKELRIGWIGTGKMGAPICRNLLKAGFQLSVFDVNSDATARLADLGASKFDSPLEMTGSCDVVFTMLPSDTALIELLCGPGGVIASMHPSQILIDMSTISPLRSTQIAEQMRQKDLAYLRAPVSGSTVSAESAQLTIYCSGPRDVFDFVTPVLARIGSNLSYCGDAEQARVLKLLINMIVCFTPTIVGEALAFGERSGLEWSSMIDALGKSAAASPVLTYKLDMLKTRDWTPMATVDTVAKDLDLALEWGRACNLPMPFTALAQQNNVAFQASGDGNLDFFSVVTWPQRWLHNSTS